MECTKCGACCVAPDIASLGKPLGVRCPHLQDDNLCGIYDRRPQICRDYEADEICVAIDAPTLEERAAKYLALFQIDPSAPPPRHTCGAAIAEYARYRSKASSAG